MNPNENSGYQQHNYITNGGKSKIFLPIIILITFLSLYITLFICINHWIYDIGLTNKWVFLSPIDEVLLAKSLFFSDMVLKYDFLKWIGVPVALHLLLFAILFRAIGAMAKSSRPSGLRHGTSRFSTKEEVENSGLLVDDLNEFLQNSQKSGVVLGRFRVGGNNLKPIYKYILDITANEHILAYAPTRSGKGVGLVIPTLFSWKDSAIVLDPKGENFEKTSGYLSSIGHTCIRLDLEFPYHRYNPLSDIDPRSLDLPDEVMRSIGIIMDEGAKNTGNGDNKFWDNQAKNLMTTALTYLIASFDPVYDSNGNLKKDSISLYDLGLLLNNIDPVTSKLITGVIAKEKVDFGDGRVWGAGEFIETTYFTEDEKQKLKDDFEVKEVGNMIATLKKISNYRNNFKRHINERGLAYFSQLGKYLVSQAEGFAAQTDNTLQNIVASCTQYLGIFMLPRIAAITSKSDFKLKDLVDPTKNPTILYIVNPPKEELTGKTDPIIKLILQNLFVSVLYETGLRDSYSPYKETVFNNLRTVSTSLETINKCRKDLEATTNEDVKQEIEQEIQYAKYNLENINYMYVEKAIFENCIKNQELKEYHQTLKNLLIKNYLEIDLDNYNNLIKNEKFLEVANVKYGYTKRAILCMLDEFPKLGKFSIMEKLLADAAGYGAKFYLIAQSDQQIFSAYGKENSIFAGCQHKVIYRPADKDTAKSLSEILGNYTYVEQTVNVNDSNNGAVDIFKSKSVSKSWTESSKPLMSPEEVLQMDDMDNIILSKKLRIFGAKLKYFEEPALKDKARIPQVKIDIKPIIQDEELNRKQLADIGIFVDKDGKLIDEVNDQDEAIKKLPF